MGVLSKRSSRRATYISEEKDNLFDVTLIADAVAIPDRDIVSAESKCKL